MNFKALVFAIFVSSFLFAIDSIFEISPAGGTQQRILLDFRSDFPYSQNHVTLLDFKGGIGSTNGMYTPRSRRPFFQGDLGLIQRYLSDPNTFLGGYLFFGQLKTPYNHYFSRFTLGIEGLKGSFRSYLNCYFPIGNREKQISGFGFTQNRIEITGNQVWDLYRYEVEVLSKYAFDAGVQNFFPKGQVCARGSFHPRTHGAPARVGGALDFSYVGHERLSINATLGYDSFYKAMGWVGLTFKLGSSRLFKEVRNNNRALPVQLEEFFWTSRKQKQKSSLLVPLVYFVNNAQVTQPPILPGSTISQSLSGDGTFKNPFITLDALNEVLPTQPDAIVYFFQGTAPYSGTEPIRLFGNQSITGQGGNWAVNGCLILRGSPTNRPFLARTNSQEMSNQQLITFSGTHSVENIGLMNLSGNVATGTSMITNQSHDAVCVKINNIYSADKITLDFNGGTHTAEISNSNIYAVILRGRNNAILNASICQNILHTNKDIAVRFNQLIGAGLFIESLNSSNVVIDHVTDNHCFNTQLDNTSHLGYGFLGSFTSNLVIADGILRNISDGQLPPNNSGSFLFQGHDTSIVNVQGCFGNLAIPITDDIELQRCSVNIKFPGFSPDQNGLQEANNGTAVSLFAPPTIITNTGSIQ